LAAQREPPPQVSGTECPAWNTPHSLPVSLKTISINLKVELIIVILKLLMSL
jgi:hypothetical protein